MANLVKTVNTFDDGSVLEFNAAAPVVPTPDPVVEVDTKTASGTEETFVPKV